MINTHFYTSQSHTTYFIRLQLLLFVFYTLNRQHVHNILHEYRTSTRTETRLHRIHRGLDIDESSSYACKLLRYSGHPECITKRNFAARVIIEDDGQHDAKCQQCICHFPSRELSGISQLLQCSVDSNRTVALF